MQRDYPSAIDSIRKFAAELGYGDEYEIEMSLSGAEGVHLTREEGYHDRYPGPFFEDEVFVRKLISSDYHTMQILEDFWEKLFSEVGAEVPESLRFKPVDG